MRVVRVVRGRWPALLCAGVLSAGCTSGGLHQPKVSDFAAGDCRSAAPAVLSIGVAVYDVAHRHRKPADVTPAMTAAQAALRALPLATDAGLRGKLTTLVTAVGFFRIGVDSNTFRARRTTEVAAAQRAVLAACTGKSTS